MNCWEILGIAETSEEGKIQEAYRQKLPGFHPEEDPEGFRRLRGAFEEALQAAAALGLFKGSRKNLRQLCAEDFAGGMGKTAVKPGVPGFGNAEGCGMGTFKLFDGSFLPSPGLP